MENNGIANLENKTEIKICKSCYKTREELKIKLRDKIFRDIFFYESESEIISEKNKRISFIEISLRVMKKKLEDKNDEIIEFKSLCKKNKFEIKKYKSKLKIMKNKIKQYKNESIIDFIKKKLKRNKLMR